MNKDFFGRTAFQIEQEIYHTQWENIRHHWDETSKGIRYLATLVLLGIFPLQFLGTTDNKVFAVDPNNIIFLKIFIMVVILLMGAITLFNQHNHYSRSMVARNVVIEIERRWNLYDADNNFIFQNLDAKLKYSKFAGKERRITNAMIQSGYIILITIVGIGFVVFSLLIRTC